MEETRAVTKEIAYCERCGNPIIVRTWFANLCHECSRAEFMEHFKSLAS